MNRLCRFTICWGILAVLVFVLWYQFLLFSSLHTRTDKVASKQGNTRRIRYPNGRTSLTKHQTEDQEKLVLLYTPMFGKMQWRDLKNSYDFTHPWNGPRCAEWRCKISYDKSDLSHSDAVIFHGQDILAIKQIQAILPQRNPKQRWVYFTHENPHNSGHYDLNIYNGIFNWTMSYRRDSDIYFPYLEYARLGRKDAALPKSDQNYAKSKDKLIAWLVSACGLLRDKLVRELMKYIPVDVYGACTSRFNQANSCGSYADCVKTKNQYKFYLAFENQLCKDYLTEKYWGTIADTETVPIVIGQDYDALAIPGSFINVLDFPSVRSLAEYLRYLDRNDTAYNEYFTWKKTYMVTLEPWTCKMCAALHDTTLPRKTYNLGEYWGVKSSCNSEPLEKVLSREN